MTARLDTVVETIAQLSKREKRELLRRLARLPEFSEDLGDIAIYLDRKGMPSRRYEEFRAELQAEGRL